MVVLGKNIRTENVNFVLEEVLSFVIQKIELVFHTCPLLAITGCGSYSNRVIDM